MFVWVHPVLFEFLIAFFHFGFEINHVCSFFFPFLLLFGKSSTSLMLCCYFNFRTFSHCFLSPSTICDKLTTSDFGLWNITLFFFSSLFSQYCFWRKLDLLTFYSLLFVSLLSFCVSLCITGLKVKVNILALGN